MIMFQCLQQLIICTVKPETQTTSFVIKTDVHQLKILRKPEKKGAVLFTVTQGFLYYSCDLLNCIRTKFY